MEIEQPFEFPDEPPIVSPVVRATLQQWYPKGLRRIRVDCRNNGGEQRLNELRLRNPEPGEPPDDSEDAIAEAIMNIANLHFQEVGEPSKYKVQFDIAERSGKVSRKACTFELPGKSGIGVHDVEEVTDLWRAYSADRAQFNLILERLMTHNDALTQRVIEMSRVSSGQVEPLLRTVDSLVAEYNMGLHMQASAMQSRLEAQFSTKHAEIEAENTREMWRTLKPALRVAAAQFGQGGTKALAAAQGIIESKDKSDALEPHEVSNAIDTEVKKIVNEPSAKPPGDPNTLLVRSVTGFLHTLTPEQWFSLQDKMTKEQWSTLGHARSAPNDDTCATEILALQTSLLANLRRAKLVQEVLGEPQREALEKIVLIAEKHTEGGSSSIDEPEARQ